MPYICTTTTQSITETERKELSRSFGEAIELIPGKSEKWLMLGFHPETAMVFGGNADLPTAMLEVDIFGTAADEDYDRLTAALTDAAHRVLHVPRERIYVKYREVSHWGFCGENF